LWKLGEHRLLIGDCTVRENVERLMGGERAGACVTDSPYGINREGIENDDPEGLRALFDGCLAVMPIDNGVIINFQSPRLFPVWLDAVRGAGHKFERALWMHKINDVTNAWRQWMMNGEIIIISTTGKPDWNKPSPPTQDCYVVTHDTETKIAHTSVKPLPVFEDVINHTTGNIYEPFAGSGTTIIAAHNLNRRCYAMEISEKYSAVILERFQTATGITPELIK
jgi:DNA modification methylase